MGYIPTEDAKERVQSERQRGTYGIYTATVVGSSGSSGHMVVVKPITSTGERATATDPTAATVLTTTIGDIGQPTEGDVVALAPIRGKEKPVVIGTIYTSESGIRSYDAGERHIGRSGHGTYLHGLFASAPSRTDDPSDAPDGATWYREDLDEYRGVEDGTTVTFDTTAV